MTTPYLPISCDFHDVLESLATRRTESVVVFLDASDTPTQVTDVLADLVTRDGAEYMILRRGTQVRLDRIVSVNGIPLPSGSS